MRTPSSSPSVHRTGIETSSFFAPNDSAPVRSASVTHSSTALAPSPLIREEQQTRARLLTVRSPAELRANHLNLGVRHSKRTLQIDIPPNHQQFRIRTPSENPYTIAVSKDLFLVKTSCTRRMNDLETASYRWEERC